MLGRLILDEDVPLNETVIVTREEKFRWSDLRVWAHGLVEKHASLAHRRVGLSVSSLTAGYATLAALDRLGCDVIFFDTRNSLGEVLRLAEKLRLGVVLAGCSDKGHVDLERHELLGEGEWSGGSTVTILTSGSTGEPKAARHTWESLSRPVRGSDQSLNPCWLLTYRPHLYAGLQVMLQCLVNRGTLAVPDLEMEPHETAKFMQTAGVQFISATPSFWRRLLLFSDTAVLRQIPLVQITLGGELVDQVILNRLRGYFPRARLVHIYATTEMGRCFSVSDGLAGFPASYLHSDSPDRVKLRVHDGELFVRSPNSMVMYDPYSSHRATTRDWFATGDLVEMRNERVHFVGRKSDMINVAGSKVFPVEVERVIRAIVGVSDVRVFGKASSLAGELVACEIIAEPGCDKGKLKDAVIRTCRAELASHQQPRIIKFVERIDLSPAGKMLRSKVG